MRHSVYNITFLCGLDARAAEQGGGSDRVWAAQPRPTQLPGQNEGQSGLIRDQRYRTGPDTGMPIPDWCSWLSAKMPMPDFVSAFLHLLMICQHHRISLTPPPPPAVYGCAGCTPFSLRTVFVHAGMPDCAASGQSGTGMKKNAVAGTNPVSECSVTGLRFRMP